MDRSQCIHTQIKQYKMKLYRVRALFTVLVRCWSIRQSVHPCTDCLSANQIKEFYAYFNKYTINLNIALGLVHKVLLQIFIITHIDGNMSHFTRVDIFNSGFRMTDVGH